MNKFFPVLSLIHRSADCFCRKIRNHQFYNNISITRENFLFGSIFGFAFCVDLVLGLFGSIFGLLSVWICLNLLGSVWIYIWVCILFGSIFGFPFCLDLFGSVCILFGSVWICLDLFRSVWICLDLFRSVWICLDLFESIWICLDPFGSAWICLEIFGSFLSI